MLIYIPTLLHMTFKQEKTNPALLRAAFRVCFQFSAPPATGQPGPRRPPLGWQETSSSEMTPKYTRCVSHGLPGDFLHFHFHRAWSVLWERARAAHWSQCQAPRGDKQAKERITGYVSRLRVHGPRAHLLPCMYFSDERFQNCGILFHSSFLAPSQHYVNEWVHVIKRHIVDFFVKCQSSQAIGIQREELTHSVGLGL